MADILYNCPSYSLETRNNALVEIFLMVSLQSLISYYFPFFLLVFPFSVYFYYNYMIKRLKNRKMDKVWIKWMIYLGK